MSPFLFRIKGSSITYRTRVRRIEADTRGSVSGNIQIGSQFSKLCEFKVQMNGWKADFNCTYEGQGNYTG